MDYNKNNCLTIPANDLAIQTNIEDLVCMICMNISFKPVLITCCERLMCLNCIKMMLKLSSKIKCPHCNNVNLNFSKPPKIISRMFDNLTFFCPYKDKGCSEKIKYHFYFEHIYNSCLLNQNSSYKFCKNCVDIYPVDSEHSCDLKIYSTNDQNISYLEKTLDSLYDKSLENNQLNSNKNGEITDNKNGNNNNMKNLFENNISRITILLSKLHNHNLTFTNNRLNPGYEQGWVCELCNDNIRNPSTPSYHCEPCVFDICEKCYIFISSRVPNSNCHNHELNLEIRPLEWECNMCGNAYYMRRSWYCDICNFDSCLYCYWK